MTHQIILLPVAAYPALATDVSVAHSPHVWYLALTVLGSFFGYEICRKLNPRAHPVLKTYLSVYGPVRTCLLVVATCMVAALGAHGMGAGKLLWPFEMALVACGLLLLLRPQLYKWVEGMATLSLLVHLWSVVITRMVEGLS